MNPPILFFIHTEFLIAPVCEIYLYRESTIVNEFQIYIKTPMNSIFCVYKGDENSCKKILRFISKAYLLNEGEDVWLQTSDIEYILKVQK